MKRIPIEELEVFMQLFGCEELQDCFRELTKGCNLTKLLTFGKRFAELYFSFLREANNSPSYAYARALLMLLIEKQGGD